VALTLEQLETRLDQLQAIRFSPTKSVRFENGTLVVYHDPKELGNAIAALQSEIALLTGAPARGHLRLSLGNGYR
jgi:hypothetical protein